VSEFPRELSRRTADPATVGDLWGPNQGMVFVAPEKANTVKNISAEAAYYVMGQAGGAKTVASLDRCGELYIRNGLGTQTMLAAAIHLDAASWKGTDSGSRRT